MAGFFKKLISGLTKTRDNVVSGLNSIFHGFSKIDDDFYEELEEMLIMGDIGVATTEKIIDDLKAKVRELKIKEPLECKQLLIDSIKEQMNLGENAYEYENRKSVLLVIGVNGVGKTTSIGKIAAGLKAQGKKVILAAADTFRAAAIEQLTEWADRAGVDIIAQHEGSDPGAVIYDAIQASKARNADVLICDTAGRLHNKVNLMKELEKINKVIGKIIPNAPHETLLVIDATTGQNGIMQAKAFKEITNITGIVLTKLDGNTKGGVALSVRHLTHIPIKFVGTSEKMDGLSEFYPERMAERILDMGDILEIVNKVEDVIDEDEAKKQAIKMKKGTYDLEDFLANLKQIKKLGPLENILKMLPQSRKMGLNNVAIDPKDLAHVEAIISSMTIEERRKPEILKATRKQRIAKGSGRSVEEVNRLLKQFEMMKDMMKKMSNGNMPF